MYKSQVWGLARLGVQPAPAWMRAFLAASEAALGASSAQSLSNTLYALALLQGRPPEAGVQLCPAALGGAPAPLTTSTAPPHLRCEVHLLRGASYEHK